MPFDTASCKTHYRVVIIGGGPAGSACALALAQRGVTDVLMVEAGEYAQFRIGESIPPESRRFFQALGIYDAFLQEGHAPCYGSCSYWGSDRRGYNDALLNPLGHGWHLDRRKFNRFMAAQAQQRGTQLLTNVRLSASAPAAGSGFVLNLTPCDAVGAVGADSATAPRPMQIHADFVVDASGARAVFARQRGSEKRSAQPLVCLAARFALNDPERIRSGMTHLEAVEQGWWYGAHLPDNSVLLAFSSDAATVKAMRLQQPEQWNNLLAAAPNTEKLTHNTTRMTGSILSFPAPSYCLDNVCGPDWLAIGDAASAYDPITSQGVIKSIANGLLAADAIGGQANMSLFAQTITGEFARYLAMRRHFYGLEQRWPGSAFWMKYQ
jgi:flavin-dependent dehydrogenase